MVDPFIFDLLTEMMTPYFGENHLPKDPYLIITFQSPPSLPILVSHGTITLIFYAKQSCRSIKSSLCSSPCITKKQYKIGAILTLTAVS